MVPSWTDADEGHVLHADADVVDVGDGAADEAPPARACLEVADRHAQQVRVDVVAQVVHHRLAQLQRQAHAEEEGELGERRPGPGSPARPATVPRGVWRRWAREHARHHPAQRRQLERPQRPPARAGVALARVGPGVAEQAADDAQVERPLLAARRGRAVSGARLRAPAAGSGARSPRPAARPSRAVGPALAHQLVVGALLDDAPVVQHEDAIGPAQGGQAVGDDERGAARRAPAPAPSNSSSSVPGSSGGGRIVQQQDARLEQQRAGQRQPLPLPARQAVAALAEPGCRSPSGSAR